MATLDNGSIFAVFRSENANYPLCSTVSNDECVRQLLRCIAQLIVDRVSHWRRFTRIRVCAVHCVSSANRLHHMKCSQNACPLIAGQSCFQEFHHTAC